MSFTNTIRTRFNQDVVLSPKEKRECLRSILQFLPKYKQIRFNLATSLYTHPGIHFCDPLRKLETVAVNPYGEVIFCCDTVGKGISLGSLGKESFIALYHKYKSLAHNFWVIRKKLMSRKNYRKIAAGCDFCSYLLPKLIENNF